MLPSERELTEVVRHRQAPPVYREDDALQAKAERMMNICRWWVAYDLHHGGVRRTSLPDPKDPLNFAGHDNPLQPQPMSLYVIVLTTALNKRGIVVEAPRPLPMSPGIIRHNLGSRIGRHHTVDVMYARRRERLVPFHILVDRHKPDDLEDSGDHKPMNGPEHPVGEAAQQAAEQAGARCRHWTVVDSARTLDSMRHESDQWSHLTGIPWRPILHALESIQDLQEAADIAEMFAKINHGP